MRKILALLDEEQREALHHRFRHRDVLRGAGGGHAEGHGRLRHALHLTGAAGANGSYAPHAGPRNLTDTFAARLRRLFRGPVESRDADKAGVTDEIEQHFHPDRHDKFPFGRNPRESGSFPNAAVTPKTKKPHRHPETPMGSFMLSSFRGSCTCIDNNFARGSFREPCAFLICRFPGSGGSRGTAA